MSFVDINDKLWLTIQSICSDEGLELYDLERAGPGALRVTVDRTAESTAKQVNFPRRRAESESVESDDTDEIEEDTIEESSDALEATQGGVSSGDCTRLCRRLVVYFTAEGPAHGIGAEPEIEVSSPGINRTLRLDRHWERAIGERVKVVLLEPRTVPEVPKPIAQATGKLEQFGGGELVVLEESLKKVVTLPKSAVKRAQIDFLFK